MRYWALAANDASAGEGQVGVGASAGVTVYNAAEWNLAVRAPGAGGSRMPETTSFWQRVRGMFRAERGPSAWSDVNGGQAGAAGEGAATGMALDSTWRRKGATPQPKDATQRLVALTDRMQEHFTKQEEQATEMSVALQRVGRVLEQLADSQRSQSEYLKTIAAQTESNGRHAASLSDTVSRIPESLLTQAEAIRAVADQMRSSQDADERLLQSLHSFGKAVDTLGTAGAAQVETLQRLSGVQREQHAALSDLVREQSRRFLIVLVIAAVLGLGALAALVVTLVLSRG